jgi:hypothetical protein
MSVDLEKLQRDVQYLMDRAAILDCVAKHARGNDRHDSDLITAAYHPDGLDEHGDQLTEGPKYAAWANAAHEASVASQSHNITTHTVEIDGDIAHAESYVMLGMISKDEKHGTIMMGRYMDRLERRDGAWKIALRRAMVDASVSGSAAALKTIVGNGKGLRNKNDISYQRPLAVDPYGPRWGR